MLLALQVSLNFQIFSNKPVPVYPYFAQSMGYKNTDEPTWLATGVMLPGNVPAVRAMRPHYPAVLTVGKWL